MSCDGCNKKSQNGLWSCEIDEEQTLWACDKCVIDLANAIASAPVLVELQRIRNAMKFMLAAASSGDVERNLEAYQALDTQRRSIYPEYYRWVIEWRKNKVEASLLPEQE